MEKKFKTIITSCIALFALLPTLTSCGFTYCQHKIETIKGEPGKCNSTGIKSYYRCELCEQLFGYDRYGLYEIDAPEIDNNGKHDLVYLPVARGLSNSISRVKYVSQCKICNEQFEIDNDDILDEQTEDIDEQEDNDEEEIEKVDEPEDIDIENNEIKEEYPIEISSDRMASIIQTNKIKSGEIDEDFINSTLSAISSVTETKEVKVQKELEQQKLWRNSVVLRH